VASDLEILLRHQAGVATLGQLVGAGVSESTVRAQLAGRRWQRVGSRCVVTHNFTVPVAQMLWVAVLDPAGPVAAAGVTVLQRRGFRYFGDELTRLHVVVRHGARYHRLPGVKIHESRRFRDEDVRHIGGLPCTGIERAALDAAAWQPSPRYACGLVAAVAQQRLSSASAMSEELRFVGRVRHKQHLRLALADIGGGAEALGELDVAGMCRRFGLPAPVHQRVRLDRSGRRRFLDCEWRLADGTVVVLEIDGSHHLDVAHWEADMKRERQIVASRRIVLRASTYEVRNEPDEVVADLLAVGVGR
jgi:hypothetical protein